MDKILITKIKRTDETRCDLYGKGHKWPDLKLFDLGELLVVGITPEELPIGVEKPCRFFAHYTLSEKLNEAGNPYRDISHLEPVANGNGTTAPAPMNDAMLAAILKELKIQTKLLQALVRSGTAAVDPFTLPEQPTTPEPGPQEPPPQEEQEAGESTLDEWFSGNTPTSPRELLQVLNEQDRVYNSVRDLHDDLAQQFGDTWKGWPPANDATAWSHITKTALQLVEA